MNNLRRYSTGVLFLTVLLFSSGCRTDLYHGLSEPQANEIVLVLIRNGMEAHKSRRSGHAGGWVVSVSKKHAAAALQTVMEHELPRENPPGFNDLFANDSLLPTSIQEKTRYFSALCGELQRTLEQDDSVSIARVHIHHADFDTRTRKNTDVPRSAAVLLKMVPGYCTNNMVPDDEIQSLIARSVGNMSPENVSVIRTRSQSRAIRETARTEKTTKNPWQLAGSPLVFGIVVLLVVGSLFIGMAGFKLMKRNILPERKGSGDETA